MLSKRVSFGSPRSALILAAGVVVVLAHSAYTQEESVNPGINDRFENPDVETFIGRFEAEDRAVYKRREEIVSALGLEPGVDVADIGAGTGFFTVLFAREVGPEGTVYAVDIAESFVSHITETARELGLDNVKGIVNSADSTGLPENSIDVAFICNTYHHFEYPFKMLESIRSALRPGGIVVNIDFERVEGLTEGWILNMVRAGKGTFTDEFRDAGFDLIEEVPFSDKTYILKLEERKSPAEALIEHK